MYVFLLCHPAAQLSTLTDLYQMGQPSGTISELKIASDQASPTLADFCTPDTQLKLMVHINL